MTLCGMIFGVESRKIREKYRDRKVTKAIVRMDKAGTVRSPLSVDRKPVYRVKIREIQRTDGRPSIFSDIYRWDTNFRFLDSIAINYAKQVAGYIQNSGIEVEAFGPKYKVRDKLKIE